MPRTEERPSAIDRFMRLDSVCKAEDLDRATLTALARDFPQGDMGDLASRILEGRGNIEYARDQLADAINMAYVASCM